MFINYNPDKGVTIDSFRNVGGYANNDVKGLIEDMLADNDGSCPLESARWALECGWLWDDTFFTQDALEAVHAAICEYEERIVEEKEKGS